MKNLLYLMLFIVLVQANKAMVPRLTDRIVGGENASILEFPYQVSLRKFNRHICGGSIFHSFYILTAAHCISEGLAAQFSIRAGSRFINRSGKLYKVCNIMLHEGYNIVTLDNDIAILKLCCPLVFSDKILPVALPQIGEEVAISSKALASGWGYEVENGRLSDNLKQVEIPIVSPNDCKKTFKKFGEITKNMICAGLTLGGKDACQGDSGGPLRVNGKLMGITSWGLGCARPQYPGVYTKVSNYRSWIKEKTNY